MVWSKRVDGVCAKTKLTLSIIVIIEDQTSGNKTSTIVGQGKRYQKAGRLKYE